jgi:hypothetical protein
MQEITTHALPPPSPPFELAAAAPVPFESDASPVEDVAPPPEALAEFEPDELVPPVALPPEVSFRPVLAFEP